MRNEFEVRIYLFIYIICIYLLAYNIHFRDLIVKIKQNRELYNYITNGYEMISDEVRISLLQVFYLLFYFLISYYN